MTAQQLKKMFERRTNFDLRRLLGGEGSTLNMWFFAGLIPFSGAEPFMHTLLQRLEGDMAVNLSALQFLKLDQFVRTRAAEALIPVSKMKVRFCRVCRARWELMGGASGYALHRVNCSRTNNHARSSEETFDPPFRYSILVTP